MFRVITTLAVFGVLSSCVEREFVLPVENIESKLAVVGYLMKGVPPEVFVSKVHSLNSTSIDQRVEGADVVLFENNIAIDTLILNADFDAACEGPGCEFLPSHYLARDTIDIIYGSVYHIEVTLPGFVSTQSLPVMPLQNLNNAILRLAVTETLSGSQNFAKIDTAYVSYDFDGGSRDQIQLEFYYNYNSLLEYRTGRGLSFRLEKPAIFLPNSKKVVESLIDPFTDSATDDGMIPLTFSIDLVRYSGEYWEFYNQVIAQSREDIGGIYASSPSPISTNMVDGYGFFTFVEHYNVEYVIPE